MDKEKYFQELAELAANGDTVTELYKKISALVMKHIPEEDKPKRCVHYLSIEYLIGRMFYNNLMELGILKETAEILKSKGIDINVFEEIEDAALGNGGLGRLAACYMDSGAAAGIPLYGYGIRYKYGLFRQKFEDGFQKEMPDDWQRYGDPWSVRKDHERLIVRFSDFTATAVPYDMPVIGRRINTLRLYQAEGSAEAEKICGVLYPPDDTEEGKLLRIRQEYFLSAATVGDILRAYESRHGKNYSHFAEENSVQLNDMHPVFAVPELIRALMENGLTYRAALKIAKQVFNYTNHTILPEALECWDAKLLKKILPEIADILYKMNVSAYHVHRTEGYTAEEICRSAIYRRGTFSMANAAVFAARKVNGVAKIHTSIIKKELFAAEAAHHPEKFLNVTNGVTPRRWMELADPELCSLIDRRIGRQWRNELSELSKLSAFAKDAEMQAGFTNVKTERKKKLFAYIAEKEGVALSEKCMLYAQIKRLHEYKRQLMTAFALLRLYYELKEGKIKDFYPSVFLFGAKSAPTYFRAKGIIKYLNEIIKKINADPGTNHLLAGVFVTEYNVSYAEKIVAAADISLQVSTAGMEASGTGNMKFMMNGAVTLGTMDGANIEIAEAAGEDNEYIFGARVEEIDRLRKGGYDPCAYLKGHAEWESIVNTLIDGTFTDGGTGYFKELYDSLTIGASWHKPDHYFILRDIEEYYRAILQANGEYKNQRSFARKQIENIAKSSSFSSDRSVREYADLIWELQ